MASPVKVMVIDANPGALSGLIRELRQTPGIRIVGAAREAGKALALAALGQADVVVFDPRRLAPDAAQFTRQLAAAAPGARLVILTAYLTEWERAGLTRAGAGAIVFKEIGSPALVQAIVPGNGELGTLDVELT